MSDAIHRTLARRANDLNNDITLTMGRMVEALELLRIWAETHPDETLVMATRSLLKRCAGGGGMSDPRWTVDEDGDIVFGDAVAEIVHEADTPHAVKKAAYTARVECVRSHDTLTRARDYAAKIRPYIGLPNVDHSALDALLDLLTGEDQ